MYTGACVVGAERISATIRAHVSASINFRRRNKPKSAAGSEGVIAEFSQSPLNTSRSVALILENDSVFEDATVEARVSETSNCVTPASRRLARPSH